VTLPLIPDASFPPGRLDPCFCGSGERFKHCCGSNDSNRKPPFGIGILESYLSAAECREWLDLIATLETDPYKMRNPDGTVVLDPTRVCDRVVFGEKQSLLDSLVARAWQDVIIPATGIPIAWYEEPQLLKYSPGGFYQYHADNGYLVIQEKAWRKAVDRDVSMLIYLTGDFEAGELHFNRFNYFLKPQAGMLVWFPSDMRYQHSARPVASGTRYAIVSWAATADIERVQDARTTRAIDWLTREKNP